MAGGLFAEWQPRYGERGIATFPVREKRPVVRGYLKVGLEASEQFAIKFPSEDAFGLACRRNRITVLDVDAPDERLLADAMSELGPTPFVVRSGSGNFQAWYRNSGEKRRVRPDPNRPLDILGDGYVVAPPSRTPKGQYTIISGTLDDLGGLPPMRTGARNDSLHNRLTPSFRPPPSPLSGGFEAEIGERNNRLWREAMKAARRCATFTELESLVMEMNAELPEPLPADEVLKVIASAFRYQEAGQNWVGGRTRIAVDAEELLAFRGSGHALKLWLLLLGHHGRRAAPFAISQVEVATMLSVHRQQMTGIIRELIAMRKLRRVHTGRGPGDPHQYVLTGGRSAIAELDAIDGAGAFRSLEGAEAETRAPAEFSVGQINRSTPLTLATPL